MTDKFLKEIREKISCPQFGDDHYGEWGILNVNQRRTIKRLIDYMDSQEAYIKNQQAEIELLKNRLKEFNNSVTTPYMETIDENKILKLEKENLQLHIQYLEREFHDLQKTAEIRAKGIDALQAEIERLKAFKSYFDELYGKGLDIANWHENGNLEPFDNFYDDAVKEMVGDDK